MFLDKGKSMLVMKFGGTSMGSADRMIGSASIICGRAEKSRVGVVVSAVSGVSNLLQAALDSALSQDDATADTPDTYFSKLTQIHKTIIDDLKEKIPNFSKYVLDIQNAQKPIYDEFDRLIHAVAAFKECPESVHCRVMGMGERLSVEIMNALLKAMTQDVMLLDSRSYIITTGSLKEADPLYDLINQAFEPLKNSESRILLMTGFVASDKDGKTSLLGRNGSDFSAALMAMGLDAERLEIWTDVDGIYTADPRIVSDALLVPEMSYEEAMELSFFGSKVLHPKTIAPIAAKNIETWSLNSFNPDAPGTRIAKGPIPSTRAVKGISCLKNVSLISVSGAGLRGRHGAAARIFSAVSRKQISVLLITQSSSEYTISFCVRDTDAEETCLALNEEFNLEIREHIINDVDVQKGLSIISIVGDGMRENRGIAATFFDALACGDVNIRAIAQGSSERSISTVITGKYSDKAVRIIHRFFFDKFQTVDLFVWGCGTIGGRLLDQINAQVKDFQEQKIRVKVMGIANSRKMLLSKKGLELSKWREELGTSETTSSIDELLDFVKEEKPLNPVFADCTATDTVPLRYEDIFKRGMHIATPNKRSNSMSWDFYQKIRTTANKNHRRFLYETNVGAGLPIIDTMQNMRKSGDKLLEFSGIMSGSLSYVFGRVSEGDDFSKAVEEAISKGFTEPDIRDDLIGADVARKVLVIAREWGLPLELKDIELVSIFPSDFDTSGNQKEFLSRLSTVNSWFSDKVQNAKKSGCVLRHVASIINGKCRVGLVDVSLSHPLAAISGGENSFVLTTKRYNPIPLVIRGYGAGAEVTAAGVFADILRTVSWSVSEHSKDNI